MTDNTYSRQMNSTGHGLFLRPSPHDPEAEATPQKHGRLLEPRAVDALTPAGVVLPNTRLEREIDSVNAAEVFNSLELHINLMNKNT